MTTPSLIENIEKLKASSYTEWRKTDLSKECKPWEGAVHQYFMEVFFETFIPTLTHAIEVECEKLHKKEIPKYLDRTIIKDEEDKNLFMMKQTGWNSALDTILATLKEINKK